MVFNTPPILSLESSEFQPFLHFWKPLQSQEKNLNRNISRQTYKTMVTALGVLFLPEEELTVMSAIRSHDWDGKTMADVRVAQS